MFALVMYILVFLFLLFFIIFLLIRMGRSMRGELDVSFLEETLSTETEVLFEEESVSSEETVYEDGETEAADETETPESDDGNTETALKGSELFIPDPYNLKEENIYTFLQGPKGWKARKDWSGSWCSKVLTDQYFSVFGCGLCVLASIYGTLTPYECSPLDMFDYAQEVSGYAPVSGYGAIDWPYLKKTLLTCGISGHLRRKNSTYEQFQEKIASSIGTIALVSSYNDDTYWDTEGHYVVIWLYDEKDDTVFLSDSGDPSHNRKRIPLRYVYDALKTASRFQYLMITAVNQEANTWKHDGINIRWKRPKYGKAAGKP